MYIESELLLDVRYYETDQMGIVHHSNYVRYFECGRSKFLEDVGIPIVEIERGGIVMPVVSVNVNYKTPAKMGDRLRIVSKVLKEPMAKIEVHTEIYKQRDELVSEGMVVRGFLHNDTRRPTRVPDFFIEAFRKASKD